MHSRVTKNGLLMSVASSISGNAQGIMRRKVSHACLREKFIACQKVNNRWVKSLRTYRHVKRTQSSLVAKLGGIRDTASI